MNLTTLTDDFLAGLTDAQLQALLDEGDMEVLQVGGSSSDGGRKHFFTSEEVMRPRPAKLHPLSRKL